MISTLKWYRQQLPFWRVFLHLHRHRDAQLGQRISRERVHFLWQRSADGTTCLPGNNNPIPNLNTGAQSSQLIINSTARVTTTTELRHRSVPGIPFYATLLPVSGLALLGVGLGGKRTRLRRLLIGLLLGALFTLIMFLPACSSSSTTTTTTGTPAGTYAVTISAVSGSATRSTVVALVIQ